MSRKIKHVAAQDGERPPWPWQHWRKLEYNGRQYPIPHPYWQQYGAELVHPYAMKYLHMKSNAEDIGPSPRDEL
jgi:hypothetical protein